ncbi:MAG: hypothetical protein ACPGXL_07910 [Chitinophagales bacterium]
MASNDLFQLIQSLKQSEKRYFKIYSSKHEKGSQSNYVKLFEAIDKQGTYDEAKLLRKFRNESFTKQFSVTKNYLFNFILRSLRAYHSGQTLVVKVREGLNDVRILYSKGLFKIAVKLLKKLKKQASDYELHQAFLEILGLENLVYSHILDVNKYENYLKEHYKEVNTTLNILKNEIAFQELTDKAYLLYRRYKTARSDEDLVEYEQILAHPLLEKIENALSVEAKRQYNHIYGLYYTVSEQFEEASFYDEQQLLLLDAYPKIKELDILSYFIATTNLLGTYIEHRKFDRIEHMQIQMRNLFHNSKFQQKLDAAEKVIAKETYYNVEFSYYFETCQFEKSLALVPEIEKIITEHQKVLDTEIIQGMAFDIARLYFYLGDLDTTLNWLNRVEERYKEGQVNDMICFTRLFKLMIYFDLGDNYYTLLYYDIKATRRFLAKYKKLYKTEDVSLHYLYRLVNSRDEVQVKKLWLTFAETLTAIQKEQYETSSMTYINVVDWVESKVQKQALKVIAQKKFEKEKLAFKAKKTFLHV